MADTKTTALTEITAPAATDLVYVVGDPGTTPVSRKATLATLRKTLMVDGWIEAGSTWTYASADAPTFTFTISGDLTGKYSPGMRIKLTQTTVKYFIITAVSYGAPNTTVTIYGGTDYTLANAAISANYYSAAKAPFGFPQDPTKWTVVVTDTTERAQASPAQNTWYNPGSLSITIPIGTWRVIYHVAAQASNSSAIGLSVQATLSTSNNSESDSELSTLLYANSTIVISTLTKEKVLVLAAKTVYYLNARTVTSSQNAIDLRNDLDKLVIRAVCAYL